MHRRVRDLMLAGTSLVTTFDDIVTRRSHADVSGATSRSVPSTPPRGLTWIGGGIQAGAAELAAATHTNRSVLVLTDGNENIHPYIAELPAGTVTDRTYAIGFGLPGHVSDEALNDITSNTGGDLIVTGSITSEEQRFMLTKYFVQVLAGVTNSQVILDPEGKLYFGSKDAIPFKVADADVYVDAILVCPIPKFVEFVLQTPGGRSSKPTTAEPGSSGSTGTGPVAIAWCFLRSLHRPPAAMPARARAAALKDEKELARLLRNKEFAATVVSPAVRNFLPYSFIRACYQQPSTQPGRCRTTAPGSRIEITRSRAYDVPFSSSASVCRSDAA
jgi:hypothetical protein